MKKSYVKYRGQRDADARPIVHVRYDVGYQTHPSDIKWVILSPERSQEVNNHSPDGFEWGYGGSGSAQLALALLLEHTDKETAVEYYQEFKWEIISVWNDDWNITGQEIEEWLKGKD